MDEVDVFDAVVKWGKQQCTQNKLDGSNLSHLKAAIADVITSVRFPIMTVNEIATRVAGSGLLDQMELVQLFSYCAQTDAAAKKKQKMPYPTKEREGVLVKDSTILVKKNNKDLVKLFERKIKLTQLYTGAKHGYTAQSFHSRCDNQGPTLLVVKSGTHVFGGYNSGSWTSTDTYGTADTFIYKLSDTELMKMTSTGGNKTYNGPSHGPTFGDGHEMYFNTNFQSAGNSSNISSYRMANGYNGTFTNTTLAGSGSWAVSEIEVYKLEFKDK